MVINTLDIDGNRSTLKYTRKEMVVRLLWAVVCPLFHFSPRPFFAWRRLLLRLFGANIGKEVHIYNSARVYMPWNLRVGDWSSIGESALVYNLGTITIGTKTTISHRAHLCAGTHDYSDPTLPLQKQPITIGDQSWICADSFVGPGVTVGDGAVVGARAVVVNNIEAWTVVAGNPAKYVKKRVLENKSGG